MMRKQTRINWITILCALAVMAAAVLVRMPAAQLYGLQEEQKAAYSTESGIPYLTDPDSYFHTRITDNQLEYGNLSRDRTKDGTLWDTQSRYPEGRSASYQPGIVHVTEFLWKIAGPLFHADLYAVEYWLPAFMAALAALAAFLFGSKISGTAGGTAAGILVSCAPAFTARVLPGRFDTDMFSAVMDVLLIWTMYEALKARTRRGRLAAASAFALTVLAYTYCWSVYAFMFSMLSLGGGAVFILLRTLMTLPARDYKKKDSERFRFRVPSEIRSWILCICFMAVLLLLINGPSFFTQFLKRASWAPSLTESGVLPNLLASVTELNRPVVVPSDPAEWFVGYVPGKTLSILNGIGGAAAAVFCLGGIVVLVVSVIIRQQKKAEPEDTAYVAGSKESSENVRKGRNTDSLLHLCLLTVWLAGTWYASLQGIRFVEHLAVPVSLLAGCCVGWIAPKPASRRTLVKMAKIILTVLICAAACLMPVIGSTQICRQNRPSVSDALAEGMAWIRDNAEDPDAVIASWWDLGYFYEYGSGHPAFWDGGSQSGLRAVLIGKALTARDLRLSGRILQMMAVHGDRPVEEMISLLGEERAFSALWDMLVTDRQDTENSLRDEYGIPQETAKELARMLHPEKKHEIYLVISGDMLYKLGWIEYYADWDFNGKGKPPAATVYSVMPDGSEDMQSDKEEARNFFASRAEETIWRLFFNADGEEVFSPVFERSDGINQIQIWKVS